jgi:hypothetical protein
MSLFLAMLKLG